MNFWPSIREAAITLWHKTLEYDRKIPAAKRERNRLERETARSKRLAKDVANEAKAEILTEIARKVKRQKEALAKLENDSVSPTKLLKSDKPWQTIQGPAKGRVMDSFFWPSEENFDFEIVGESNYQSVIARFAGDHGEDSAEEECVASLVPEDTNKFDSKAVAVKIQGRTVGYLSREDATRFRRRLASKGLSGMETTCAALIVGGFTTKKGKIGHYGVKLDIKPFD